MFSGVATTQQRRTFSGVIFAHSVLVTEFRSWVYLTEARKISCKKEKTFNPNHQNFLASTTAFHKLTTNKQKIEPRYWRCKARVAPWGVGLVGFK